MDKAYAVSWGYKIDRWYCYCKGCDTLVSCDAGITESKYARTDYRIKMLEHATLDCYHSMFPNKPIDWNKKEEFETAKINLMIQLEKQKVGQSIADSLSNICIVLKDLLKLQTPTTH